jgi:anti-sigma-K factor RsiG
MAKGSATDGSRTERVLAAEFVASLEEAGTDELRRRRDEAMAEREFQSFLRRLIQVRQDILIAERDRRASGGELEPVVDRLMHVLAEGPQGRGRGEVVRVTLPDEDVARAESQADAMLGEASADHPEALSDEQLEQALAALDRGERSISADRIAVFKVCDRLQEELKRRYRDDPSQIPTNV